ncbi:hypothetical protein DVH24_019998 [Malus domestica]|uniref:ABCC10-like N-terminal domain-containing protein n=1 Tax=Malus domestica TaxID=3750 RepID=A0A498I1U7_MALDO|nr:hypothetical protein DVH24_019998 [Malus domestica]
MGEGFGTLFCSSSNCSTESRTECTSGFLSVFDPDSCLNNIFIIAVDIFILFILLCFFIYRISSKKIIAPSDSHTFHALSIVSASLNSGLAFAYLGFGIWKIVDKVNTDQTVLPLHGWLVLFFQGFTWLLLSLTITLKKPHSPHIVIAKAFSILAFLLAVSICSSSIWEAVVDEAVTVNVVLNILYFPGSIPLLFSAFQGSNIFTKGDLELHDDAFYAPLQGEESDVRDQISSNDNVTPFAKASQRKAILVSALFALIKILTLSSGPLFLMAFINVAEGNAAFKYEGYALTLALTVLIVTVVASYPLRMFQHEYQKKLMAAQNRRLKAIAEALTNMKILKLYSWVTNFKKEPIKLIPDVFGAFIEAKISLSRIVKFLDEPELENRYTRKDSNGREVQVYGKIAYVSQSAWFQTGTIQENILFGLRSIPINA